MPNRIITSQTEYFYQKRGGKEFIETFKAYWPKSVELIIYYEGDIIRDDDENIKWHWFDEVEEWGTWEKRLSYFPVMCGNVGGRYEVQCDARHWRKAFMEWHAVKNFGGKVFWLDSDVITFDQVPETFLDELLPDDKMCCYLGRKNFYSETGFIGWNSDNPLTSHFFKAYLDFFRTGAIFACPSWHDCMGFDKVKEIIQREDLFNDLAKDLPEDTMHPFVNSILGKYLDHMKGKRKGNGSWVEDISVERPEEYWKNRKSRPPVEKYAAASVGEIAGESTSNARNQQVLQEFSQDISQGMNLPSEGAPVESSMRPAA